MGCGSSTVQTSPAPETQITGPGHETNVGEASSAVYSSVQASATVADATQVSAHQKEEQSRKEDGDEGSKACPRAQSMLPPIKDAIGANRQVPPETGAHMLAHLFSHATPCHDVRHKDKGSADLNSKQDAGTEEHVHHADASESKSRHHHKHRHKKHHHKHKHHHRSRSPRCLALQGDL